VCVTIISYVGKGYSFDNDNKAEHIVASNTENMMA
jgi:hypothetical protein